MKRLRLISFITTLLTGLFLWSSVYYAKNIQEIRTPIIIYCVILIIATIVGIIFIIKINKGAFFSILFFFIIGLSIIMQRYILNMYINNDSVNRFNMNTDSIPLIILAAHCIINMLLGVVNYAMTLTEIKN